MEGKKLMSIEEANRLEVMKRVDKNILNMRRASEELGVSLRQTKRIRKSYLNAGEIGLISKKRGKTSNRKTAENIRTQVMDLLTTIYQNFGPTLASEKLEERDQIKLSAETLRKWMIETGMHRPKKRKVGRVYQRRTRRSRFGEMLQGDGSPHAWFEDRGERCNLVQLVDDATGQTTVARFVTAETTEGYQTILQEHLEKHGKPQALYVDKHAIFRVNREELKKGTGITRLGQALKDLKIELICANSPQAKGRVERRNGVFQDRLIKEMRLHGINDMEAGNAFLPKFLSQFNSRFGVQAANPEDAHRPLSSHENLKRIFGRHETRVLSKDLTFQYHGTLYMIDTKTPNRMKHASVAIIHMKDEPMLVEYNGTKLLYKKWSETAYEKPQICNSKEMEVTRLGCQKATRPRRHHPWR
jgi:hypothetical protein